MSQMVADPEQRVVLTGVRWSTYLALVSEDGPIRGRIAYDQGALEIMTPSEAHENLKRLMGRLIETLTLVLNIELRSLGSTTLKREDLEKGLEADECYLIGPHSTRDGESKYEFPKDPPPDLAIEVDISRNSMNKFGIYDGLGIGEVWRHDGDHLRISLRSPDGTYSESERSALFPLLSVAKLEEFLEQRHTVNETDVIRSFYRWVEAEGKREAE